jgi:hypothetical protein
MAVAGKRPKLEAHGESDQHKEARRFQGDLVAREKNQRKNGQGQDSEAVRVRRRRKIHEVLSFPTYEALIV